MADQYVQDHIHLAESLGGAPENAPIYQWVVSKRSQIPVFDINVQRSLDGTPFAYVVKKGGTPVQHQDFSYTVRLEGDADRGVAGSNTVWDYQDRLLDLIGKRLYLVDNRHPANGLDHTAFIRPVMISRVGDIQDEHPLLRYFYVQVYLADITVPS